MDTLENKVVIVTGGSSGIGRATARAFRAAGAEVLVTGRRQAALDAAAAACPGIETLQADAAEPADAERTVARALNRWGRLDVLVNNAGAGEQMALSDTTADRLTAIYAANAIGPALLAAASVSSLSATQGAIVNVSSTLARKAAPAFSAYAASKAALEQLTRCWALELAPLGIRVNAVASGPVESAFLREEMKFSAEAADAIRDAERAQIPLGRRGDPEDVAQWIVALAGPASHWVTGQILGVDGGFSLV